MSDAAYEKDYASGTGSGSGSDLAHPPPEPLPQHTGFKRLYYHPVVQVFMLGFVCFMCPGLFNALNGLGGGGQLTATVADNANSALYATFAFTAFFAGCARPRIVLQPRTNLL